MTRNILRWIMLSVCMFVLGPIAGSFASGLNADDGGAHGSLLTAASSGGAILAVGVAIALAGIGGVVCSRLFGVRTGLFATGLVLVWTASRAGTVDGIVRRVQEASVLRTLAIEGVVIAILTFALAWLVVRAAPKVTEPASDVFVDDRGVLARSLGALGLCMAAGAVAAMVVARSPSPVQAVAAASAAGAAGAMMALLVHQRSAAHWLIGALGVLAFVGPASAGLTSGDIVRSAYSGGILSLANMTPLHWAAGLLLGVPVGLSWGSSLTKKSAEGTPH